MIDSARSTDDLLKDLEEAVRVRDRERATEIEQAILQRLLACGEPHVT
jgi:hypothetical protein